MESLNSTSIFEQTPETTPAASTPVSSSSLESDSFLNLITYFLISGESIIHIVTLAISSLNLMVLASTKSLHPNLKFILICHSGTIFFFEFFRITQIVQTFISNDFSNQGGVFLQMFLLFFGYFRSLTIHLLFIERLIASVWLEKYESYKKTTFSICWCTFVIAICFINMATNGKSWESTTLNMVTAFVLLILSLAECVFIVIIGTYSRGQYNQQMENAHNLNNFLGARYQLAENMKTSRQLFPAFFCNFISNFLGFCILFLMYKCNMVQNSMNIIFAFFVALGSILNAIVETTIITHHPVLKKRFNFLLNKFFRCHGGKVTDGIVQLQQQQTDGTTATKKNGTAEFEDHFKMMDELWK